MSLYLVSDFAYEMRDVSGTPENILYAFLGAAPLLSESEIIVILDGKELGIGAADAIDLLLWYGFLGFLGDSTKPLFIYDVEYDFRRLEAERMRLKGDLVYVVNPAFMKGLERAA